MFRKILCPTDFSPAGRNAVRAAAQLAAQHGAEVELLHAWFVPTSSYAGTFVLPDQVIASIRDDASRALAAAAREAGQAGARRVTTRLVGGVAWTTIVDALANEAFDLCVMGTHGRAGISRLLVGSVAEKVLRSAPAPVLTIRPDIAGGRYRHVLCPIDFSQDADAAVELARDLVSPGGIITLLHVLPPPVGTYGGAVPVGFVGELEHAAAEALATRAARLEPLHLVQTRALRGDPSAEILRMLDLDASIDVVAMASTARSGLARLLLGSVVDHVVRHARTPVLVAGQTARESERAEARGRDLERALGRGARRRVDDHLAPSHFVP